MRLVHGTTTRHLDQILKEGLRPRWSRESVWENCPSNPRMVYLSSAYALHYAMNSIGSIGEADDCLLVEVEVNKQFLYPDEDFYAQAMFDCNQTCLIERTLASIPLIEFGLSDKRRRELAELSLLRMGNCCHMGTIHPRAIRRLAVIPRDKLWRIVMGGFDPTITILNFAIMGDHYVRLQQELLKTYQIEKP